MNVETKNDIAIKIQMENDPVTYSNSARCCAASMLLLCLGLFYIPFIVLDLWIAYSDDGCVTDNHFITLKTWLQVSSFTTIGYITFVSIYTSCFVSRKSTETAFIILKVIRLLMELFSLSWLIVGSVLFWRDVINCDQGGLRGCIPCNSFTNDYMYARLILSYIGIFMFAKTGNKEK